MRLPIAHVQASDMDVAQVLILFVMEWKMYGFSDTIYSKKMYSH